MTKNDNDDNVMRANMWFAFFGGFFNVKTRDIWKGAGTCDNKEGDIMWE